MKKKLLVLIFIFFIKIVYSQNLCLWDGESASDISCTYAYGNISNTNAYQKSYCFDGVPDQWHHPTIMLNCRPTWRCNISGFDEIWFWAKCSVTGQKIHFSVSGWPNTSRSIDITPYIVGGGGLTTSYKLVRIPIDSLKTDQYSLGNIEFLYFGTSDPGSPSYHVYIDDIWAMDLKPTEVQSTEILSNKVLKLTIKDKYDTTDVKNLAHYTISSTTDPNYVSPQIAAGLGMHYFVKTYDPAGSFNNPMPVIQYELMPYFEYPFINGNTYTLTVADVKDAGGNSLPDPYTYTFTFYDYTYINGTVKANHVGYLPQSPKFGYIGNWLGNAGAMEIDDVNPPTFQVRDAQTNNVVYSGVSSLRNCLASSSCGNHDIKYDTRWSGEKVFSCDFTNLTVPGKYYLYVPGLGRSYNFAIDNTVYDSVYYHTARALFYQRCGMDLLPPYADSRWQHTACHVNDGVIHSSQESSPLYNNEPVDAIVPMPKGWHDAGDYGKYIPAVAQAIHDMFTAYELFPEKFGEGFTNIPEKNNGVPDILDEIKYEIDWIKEMQAPDGGVYFKITTTNWPNGMPENDIATRYIAEKTTFSTAHFAAMLAAAYRNFKPFYPDYADDCLARAEKAWNFLINHPDPIPANGFVNPPGIGGGEYGDPDGDVDERAWAAAELYKSTGNAIYQTAFNTYWAQHPADWGWNDFQHHQLKASWTYATITAFPTDAVKVNLIKSAFTNMAQELVNAVSKTAYRSSYRSDVIQWIGWGAWSQSTSYAWRLIKYAALTGNTNYITTAKINLDVQLGNNPQNRSYITGVGDNYPMDPLQWPSKSDGVVEPVPGIPVNGVHQYLGYGNYYGATQSPQNLYPAGNEECSPYPALRRYYDVFENVAMSEFYLPSIANALLAFAYFSSPNIIGNTPSPLPITWKNAWARVITDNQIDVYWDIEQEINCHHYEVEKMEDNQNFKKIGEVPAAGNSSTPLHYSFSDFNALPGIHYYRIKAIDNDESFSYSKVVSATLADKNSITVLPNPTKGKLMIQSDKNLAGAILKLRNIIGQILIEKINLTGNTFDLDISEQPDGIYFIEIIRNGNSKRIKVLKE